MKLKIVAISLLLVAVGIIVVLALRTQNKFIESSSYAATANFFFGIFPMVLF